MDRKEIKEAAKAKIKGNLWKILWPTIAIGAVTSLVTTIFAPNGTTYTIVPETMAVTYNSVSPVATLIISLVGIVCGIATIAYKKYVLNFTRTGKCDFKDIIECLKAKWLNIFIAELVMGLLIGLASLLLVVPGIILALAYTMVPYLVVDTELGGVDTLKKSREMMKGYKGDYFVFMLSFFGWIILACCTCGILLIWLAPYMEVAEAIYYDKLKEKTKVA